MKKPHNFAKSLSSETIVEKPINAFLNLHDEVGVLARAFNKKIELLNALANHHSLTGLPNRNSLEEKLCEKNKSCIQNKKHLM